ncbi:shikimate dehydrogenase [Asanoa sp. NPDC049573]|uniref:shikimate dehydrogenase n=1 Tax=Asanoa sp. NPDC049573 TaxID=3155396 RepID=UPI003431B1C7
MLVGLIGSGIGTSLTPALHEREADLLGMRCLYRLLDLDQLDAEPGEVVAAARLAGYDGLNITHPAKTVVLECLDDLSPDAAALGAVNTVVFSGGRATGHNTDLTGFARGFRLGLPDAPLGRVVLVGAGGAGVAVAQALASLGTERLWVVDVDPDRSANVAEGVTKRFGAGRASAVPLSDLEVALADADGLVHATPTGMSGHPGLPVPAECLRPDLWVADIVYRPLETELVRRAHANGCRVLDGGRMAVFQAVDAFRLFTGVEPDAGRMLLHFDELCRRDEERSHAYR